MWRLPEHPAPERDEAQGGATASVGGGGRGAGGALKKIKNITTRAIGVDHLDAAGRAEGSEP